MIPSQFGNSLEQFARAFADKDDDGVFRYEAERVDDATREMAGQDDTDKWFDTSTDPELAKALAEARAVANKHVDEPDPTQHPAPASPREEAPRESSQREIESGSGIVSGVRAGEPASPAVESQPRQEAQREPVQPSELRPEDYGQFQRPPMPPQPGQ